MPAAANLSLRQVSMKKPRVSPSTCGSTISAPPIGVGRNLTLPPPCDEPTHYPRSSPRKREPCGVQLGALALGLAPSGTHEINLGPRFRRDERTFWRRRSPRLRQQRQQIFPIAARAQGRGERLQLDVRYPALPPGDLLRAADLQPLALLNDAHEHARVQQ